MLHSFDHDLNIALIGASGGIGNAFLKLLETQDNVSKIYAFSRSTTQTASDKVTTGKIDYEDESTIEKAAGLITEPLDIILITTGLLHNEDLQPEKSIRDLTLENFQEIMIPNMIGPALIGKYFLTKLNRERKSIFAAISARVGSISDNYLGGWYAYRSSKAALNMVLKNFAIEVARKNKKAIILGLHPGTVDTNLSAPFQTHVKEGKLFTPIFSAESLTKNVLDKVSAADTGRLFAWDGSEIPY